jgi:hypothetical protein
MSSTPAAPACEYGAISWYAGEQLDDIKFRVNIFGAGPAGPALRTENYKTASDAAAAMVSKGFQPLLNTATIRLCGALQCGDRSENLVLLLSRDAYSYNNE